MTQLENNNENDLSPLNSGILFTFVEKVVNGFFKETTQSGIIVDIGKNFEYSAKNLRVGIVAAIGPKVTGIQIGDKIVINHLRWSHSSITHPLTKNPLWLTTEKDVAGILE